FGTRLFEARKRSGVKSLCEFTLQLQSFVARDAVGDGAIGERGRGCVVLSFAEAPPFGSDLFTKAGDLPLEDDNLWRLRVEVLADGLQLGLVFGQLLFKRGNQLQRDLCVLDRIDLLGGLPV